MIYTDMPMHSYDKLIKQYPDCPKSVPFGLLNESQAQKNHYQTLQRLAERGGLYPIEMIAVIAKRAFIQGQDIGMAIESINTHIYLYNKRLEINKI